MQHYYIDVITRYSGYSFFSLCAWRIKRNSKYLLASVRACDEKAIRSRQRYTIACIRVSFILHTRTETIIPIRHSVRSYMRVRMNGKSYKSKAERYPAGIRTVMALRPLEISERYLYCIHATGII